MGTADEQQRGAAAVGYMPQLDGIRALAAGTVIIEHWWAWLGTPVPYLFDFLGIAYWGVECFFVLSGFLITLILLDIKGKNPPLRSGLWRFYARRALRIFPPYYATIIVGAALMPPMREVIYWHALYLSDVYPLWHAGQWPPAAGHFWSLAVEEQFYLVWPFVVLALPVPMLKRVALGLCVLAPLSRYALWHAVGVEQLIIYTSPTSALDLLGFGAFLACLSSEKKLSKYSAFTERLKVAGFIALLAYPFLFLYLRETVLFAAIDRTLLALVFGAFIAFAANGYDGLLGKTLTSSPLLWLGTVSYGLYIYHPFVPYLYRYFRRVFGLMHSSYFAASYVQLPIMALILFALTAASYYLLERPIRAWRRYFA